MSEIITIEEVQTLLKKYCEWFNKNTQLQETGNVIEITTSFVDRHNDLIQIFVNKENNDYILTDYGYTIQDLESSGFTLDTPKRQSAFSVILNGFGVVEDREFLKIKANNENFSLKYQNLLQAICTVNDLYYLAEPKPTPVFVEKVHSWLNENKVRFEREKNITGYSGLNLTVDIFVPRFNGEKDKIIQLIDPPTPSNIQKFVLQWGDISRNKNNKLKSYAALNNEIKIRNQTYRISDLSINALRKYRVVPLYWTNRDDLINDFVKT